MSDHSSPRRRHYRVFGHTEPRHKTVGEAREAEYQQRKAEIPPDTRSEAQILMGEPVVGRRAIDQRSRA